MCSVKTTIAGLKEGSKKKMPQKKTAYSLQYTGNIIILILCFLLFFPLALILLLKNMQVLKGKTYLAFSYRGSYGWLIFWTIVFFPIAIILLFAKGVDLVEWKA
jgi:hypothetical protein